MGTFLVQRSKAAAVLLGYDWPGNVRELRNVIERAMVLEESDWIQSSSLQIISAHGDLPPAGRCLARRKTSLTSAWKKPRRTCW